MEPFELIFNNDTKEGIHSGGFSVNSVMLKKGIPPLKTLNIRRDINDDNDLSGGGTSQVSDLFNSLVVPNWAFSEGKMFGGGTLRHMVEKKEEEEQEDESDFLDDDLHDKLLGLVKEHEKKEHDTTQNNANHRKNEKKTKRIVRSKKGGTKRLKIH
jgi:hypothetical protein